MFAFLLILLLKILNLGDNVQFALKLGIFLAFLNVQKIYHIFKMAASVGKMEVKICYIFSGLWQISN